MLLHQKKTPKESAWSHCHCPQGLGTAWWHRLLFFPSLCTDPPEPITPHKQRDLWERGGIWHTQVWGRTCPFCRTFLLIPQYKPGAQCFQQHRAEQQLLCPRREWIPGLFRQGQFSVLAWRALRVSLVFHSPSLLLPVCPQCFVA